MSKLPFTNNELLRYSRQILLTEIGTQGQKRLKSAKVLCVGLGGLGSPALLYLAAAGIGQLGIIDDDIVELSNLQRQILFTEKELDTQKIKSATSHLKALNPNIEIVAYDERITEKKVQNIFSDYDVIVDGSDNFETHYLVNDACFVLNKPNVYASLYQFEGQCTVFTTNDGPCYRCLYPNPPNDLNLNCNENGVIGALPGILGTIQAMEVLKLILDIGSPLIGRLLTVNALSMEFKEFKLKQNSECLLCGYQLPFHELPRHQQPTCETMNEEKPITVAQLKKMMQEKDQFVLLDVREPIERESYHIGGQLIPISELEKYLHEFDTNQCYIIYCRTDKRSQYAAKLLKNVGIKSVMYLKGGIVEWLKKTDQDCLRSICNEKETS